MYESQVLCSFGDKIVFGRMLNSSALECVAPSQAADGLYPVRVSLNGVDFYPKAGTSLMYTSVGQVISISPWHGPSTGGTLVSVTGSSFPDLPVRCLFNGMSVAALRISVSLITCYTPDMSGQLELDFRLSISFGTKTIASNLYFHSDRPVIISSIYPRQVPVSSGKNFSIMLQGFGFVGYDDICCKIGGERSLARWVSPNNVSCELSPLMTPGIRNVELSLNGKDFSVGPYIVTVAEMVIYSLYPSIGPQQGFTSITVVTSGFNVSSSYFCVLDDFYTKAVMDNSGNRITCLSPPSMLSSGVKYLSIFSLDLNEHSNMLPFEYVSGIKVSSVEPLTGPVTGNTGVAFHLNSPNITSIIHSITPMCSFGGVVVPGVLVTTYKDSILCRTPPNTFGSSNISLSLNGFDFEPIVHKFYYYDNPVILDFYPKTISSNTSSLISIIGSAFEYRAWYCKYSDTVIEAEWISNSLIRCFVQFVPGVGTVSISANKIDWFGMFIVQSQVTLELLSTSQNVAPWNGNVNISIFGYGFPVNFTSPYILIKSTNTNSRRIVNATILSSSLISLQMPTWENVDDILLVSLVLDSFKSNALELKIHKSFEILDIYPHFGIYNGNTALNIFASDLPESDVTFTVIFILLDGRHFEVEVSRVNNSLSVLSPSPDFGASNVTHETFVQIAVSSGYLSNTMQYYYLPEITLFNVEPEVILEHGGPVYIYGVNIPQGIPFLCRISDLVSESLIVTNEYVACLAPPYMLGNVSIYLSPNNGSDYIYAGHLRYVSPPESLHISPSSGPINGGTIVTITGVNAVSFSDSIVLCRFGVLEVLSTVNLEQNTLVCISPKVSSAETVLFSLSIRHQFGKLVDSMDFGDEFVFYGRICVSLFSFLYLFLLNNSLLFY